MTKYAVVWLTDDVAPEERDTPPFDTYVEARSYKDEHPKGKFAAVIRVSED